MAKDLLKSVNWVNQDAVSLTFQDNSFKVVFMSHLLHHIDSPLDVIRECKRVLKPSGTVIIRYGAMNQIRNDAEHTFFPEALEIDEVRAQTSESTERWLTDAGFVNITSRKIIQQTFNTGSERLNAARVKNTSVLNMISKEAFETGMSCFTEYVDRNPNDRWLLFDQMTLTVGNKG